MNQYQLMENQFRKALLNNGLCEPFTKKYLEENDVKVFTKAEGHIEYYWLFIGNKEISNCSINILR